MAKPTTKKPRKQADKSKATASGNPYGLNEKQWRFVVHYVADPNGAKAARLAGYSEHTAAEIASENLRKPAISAAISHLIAKRAQMHAHSADQVLQGIARIAFMPDEEMPGRKIADQLKALELLGRYYQLWEPKAGGGSKAPPGTATDARETLLKLMAGMARRDAVDIRAEVEEDKMPALLPQPEKANG